jgi:DNA-binding IclR family transcriptional regulator
MEKNEISRHEILVYQALAEGKWVTNQEIADKTGVAPRTARHHTLRLVKLGIADQAELFPAHRYRLSEYAAKRNRGYADRIGRAAEIFGLAATGA